MIKFLDKVRLVYQYVTKRYFIVILHFSCFDDYCRIDKMVLIIPTDNMCHKLGYTDCSIVCYFVGYSYNLANFNMFSGFIHDLMIVLHIRCHFSGFNLTSYLCYHSYNSLLFSFLLISYSILNSTFLFITFPSCTYTLYSLN